jgi:hypothetical protein
MKDKLRTPRPGDLARWIDYDMGQTFTGIIIRYYKRGEGRAGFMDCQMLVKGQMIDVCSWQCEVLTENQ